MRLTPLDIKKQEFSRGLRGYDPEEVHSFLQMVSSQWEELLDDHRRQDEKIRDLMSKMEHYERVEDALQEALQTARETSKKALENAEQKAALTISQAEQRADEIKRDAEQERYEIKREAAKLSGRRSEIVTRLRAFLMSEMELLARYEGDDPVGFIKLLPAEKSRVQRLAEQLESQDEDADLEIPDDEVQDVSAESPDRPKPIHDEPAEDSFPDEEAARIDDPIREIAAQVAPGSSRADADQAAARTSDEAPEPERHVHDWTRPVSDQRGEGWEHPEGGVEFDEYDDDDDSGQGWTTRTVVSMPSERDSPEDEPDDQRGPEEATRTGGSSEEIEKIRRILSDLD